MDQTKYILGTALLEESLSPSLFRCDGVKKTVFDNIMHTVMNSNRTKDNKKVRMDLEEHCRCP